MPDTKKTAKLPYPGINPLVGLIGFLIIALGYYVDHIPLNYAIVAAGIFWILVGYFGWYLKRKLN